MRIRRRLAVPEGQENLEPRSKPGTNHQNTDSSDDLLDLIVESISHEPFHGSIPARITGPRSMPALLPHPRLRLGTLRCVGRTQRHERNGNHWPKERSVSTLLCVGDIRFVPYACSRSAEVPTATPTTDRPHHMAFER